MCHNKPVFIPPCKPHNPMKDLYNGQTYELNTRVDVWTRMDVVTVEYGTFNHKFHLKILLFHLITGINFKWDYVIWRISCYAI